MGRDLADMARRAGLPAGDVERVDELLRHDEDGLALEELCIALEQEGAAVDEGDLALIARRGMGMMLDSDLWGKIAVRPGRPGPGGPLGGYARRVDSPREGLVFLGAFPARTWTGPCSYAALLDPGYGPGVSLVVAVRGGGGRVELASLRVFWAAAGPFAPPAAPEAPPERARALLAALAEGGREGPCRLDVSLSGGRAVVLARGARPSDLEAVSLGGACRLLFCGGRLRGAEFPSLSAGELAELRASGVAPSPLNPPGMRLQGFAAYLWARAAPSCETAAERAYRALLALRGGMPERARPRLWASEDGSGEEVSWERAAFLAALLGRVPGEPGLNWRAELRSSEARGAFAFGLEFGSDWDFLAVHPPLSFDPRADAGAADLLARALSLAGEAFGAEWGFAGSSALPSESFLDERGLPRSAHWANWLSPALLSRVGEEAVRRFAAGERRASFDGRLLRLGRLALDAYDPGDERLRLRASAALLGGEGGPSAPAG